MSAKTLGAVRRKFAPWDDPSATPLIEIRNLTKRFGDFTAVDHVSLKIYEREFFALLGPSGCGKTTLMRMLAGFEEPSAGEILIGGQSMNSIPPHKRPVNMMFQSYALFPHMTVEKNIAFGLEMDKLPKSEIDACVKDMLRLVKLEPFATRKPHQLSGGQRQRVALARALAKKPKVLLLDEPLGALDKKLREETQFELLDLQMQLGMTFVIVTHDQDEAMTMADRIAVMDRGQFIQISSPAELYEQPNTKYIADFIGDINLIEGRVTHNERGRVTLDSDMTGGRIDVHAETTAGLGDKAWFALRPEKASLSLLPPNDPTTNCARGTVWDIGYVGDLSVYHIRLDQGGTMRASIANTSRVVERPITWEDSVYLTWAPDSGVILLN
ncbi:MAG: ABC transporter ATP-binding protein [Hyphomicrobiales bacterium]